MTDRLRKVSKAYDECMSHVDINNRAGDFTMTIDGLPEETNAVMAEVIRSFPELQKAHIFWSPRPLSMTMMARPDVESLLFRSKRKYLLLVNNQEGNGRLLLSQLPREAQKGILAHELCHILDYEFKTRWQIIKTGFIYLFPGWKEVYEKATDYLAIKKGFGSQLKAWSHFVLHEANVSEDYRNTKRKYYLNPIEIAVLDDMIKEVSSWGS